MAFLTTSKINGCINVIVDKLVNFKYDFFKILTDKKSLFILNVMITSIFGQEVKLLIVVKLESFIKFVNFVHTFHYYTLVFLQLCLKAIAHTK